MGDKRGRTGVVKGRGTGETSRPPRSGSQGELANDLLMRSSLAQLCRQWKIADVLHDRLAGVTANPAQVSGDLALVDRRVDVDEEMAPDGIGAGDDILLRRFNGRAAGVLLNSDGLRALAVGGAAVADPALVFYHRLQKGGGARHGLRRWCEVLTV